MPNFSAIRTNSANDPAHIFRMTNRACRMSSKRLPARIDRELGIDRETVSRYWGLAKPANSTTGSEDSYLKPDSLPSSSLEAILQRFEIR
jgi:hypothetical protein